jgi:hypothetical protein
MFCAKTQKLSLKEHESYKLCTSSQSNLLEKPPVAQLAKTLHTLYRTSNSITIFTKPLTGLYFEPEE